LTGGHGFGRKQTQPMNGTRRHARAYEHHLACKLRQDSDRVNARASGRCCAPGPFPD
jgi:hypothetical protein